MPTPTPSRDDFPSDEQVARMRDAVLETYIRKIPQAAPAPGTSLYAIIEASALIWAIAFDEDDVERLIGFLEFDKQGGVNTPAPSLEAITPLENRDGTPNEDHPAVKNPESAPAPAATTATQSDWPCKQDAKPKPGA